MRRLPTLASILAALVVSGSASLSAQGDFVAPRYVSGDLPAPPVLGVSGGEVFLEGVVTDARIDVSSPAFDEAAIGAARAWSFRPARRDGRAITTRAYLIFAFQQPVTGR